LKRLVPGGHVKLRFTDPTAYRTATTQLPDATTHDDTLALTLPSDGSQRTLRTILDRLDTAGIDADELTVHTPDLDDVFFALTTHNNTAPTASTAAKETVR
ncbi:ABC transporter, partial [Streptomyces sp. NPDC002530]